MLKKVLFRVINKEQFIRKYSGNVLMQPLKIAVCGAASQTGQIVSFFLKQSQYNLDISLYDASPNLSQLSKQLTLINTKARIETNIGPIKLRTALKDADIVAILVSSKSYNQHRPTPADIFEQNFTPVANIAKCCMEVCPDAVLAISTEPLNCIIPATNEIFKYFGIAKSDKIIGITTMDVMQAGIVYASLYNLDPNDVFVPLTGGTSSNTIVPIFSESSPSPQREIGRDHAERLYNHFLEHKHLSINAALSMGYAITKFIESLIRAYLGEKDVVETAFVAANEEAPSKYITSLIDLGENGVQTVYGTPINLSRFEKKIMHSAMGNLQRDIAMAEKHVFASTFKKTELRMR